MLLCHMARPVAVQATSLERRVELMETFDLASLTKDIAALKERMRFAEDKLDITKQSEGQAQLLEQKAVQGQQQTFYTPARPELPSLSSLISTDSDSESAWSAPSIDWNLIVRNIR